MTKSPYDWDWAGLCREGTSDKVWRIIVHKIGEQYVCTRYWGRRGRDLNSQSKMFPSQYSAIDLASKLRTQKEKKGYKTVPSEMVDIVLGDGAAPEKTLPKAKRGRKVQEKVETSKRVFSLED